LPDGRVSCFPDSCVSEAGGYVEIGRRMFVKSTQLEFQTTYDEFHDKIRYYLERVVGKPEAEDLTQEVFLKIHKGLHRFKGESKLSTWIYRIATNAALDRLRSSSFRQRNRELSVSRGDGEPDIELADQDTETARRVPVPSEEVVRGEMDECILEFVNRLPPDYRTVIVLSELKELKNQEIADILGISLDAVKIRLHRARVRLKKEFESGCTFHRDDDGELSCDRKA
jgi:RNA polymerase sigma-70 factor (ECF subfamily)